MAYATAETGTQAVGVWPPPKTQDRIASLIMFGVEKHKGLVRVKPAVAKVASYILRYIYAFIYETGQSADPIRGYAYPPYPSDPKYILVGAPWIELQTQRGYVILVDMLSLERVRKVPYYTGIKESVKFVSTKSPQLVASLAQPIKTPVWATVQARYAILTGDALVIDKAVDLFSKAKGKGPVPFLYLPPSAPGDDAIEAKTDAKAAKAAPDDRGISWVPIAIGAGVVALLWALF